MAVRARKAKRMHTRTVTARRVVEKRKKHWWEIEIYLGSVSLEEKALFAKHVGVMLDAGLTINESIAIARDSAKGKMRHILDSILVSVEAGQPFASALEDHKKDFSGLFINSIKTGEQSGTLSTNLQHVADQLEKEKDLVAKVKGAMMYPTIVLVATFGLGLLLAFFILPKIVPLFKGLKTELPMSTRALIWIADVVELHGSLIAMSIALFVVLFVWFIRQRWSHPITHFVLLKLPIVNQVIIKSQLTRFSLTLGTLIKSGLTVDESLQITKETMGNYYYTRALNRAYARLQKGTKMAESLRRYPDLFPILTTSMIRVGEESGNMDETLIYLSGFYQTEVDTATKALSSAIEPMLLVIIGGVVGFLALSIITPIYEITGSVSRQ